MGIFLKIVLYTYIYAYLKGEQKVNWSVLRII